MRELAGTRQSISLAQVATEAPPIDAPSYAQWPQRRTGRGRLYAVTPQPAEVDVLPAPIDVDALPESKESANTLVRQFLYPSLKPKQLVARTPHMLTTEEFIEVRLATVRESTRHCFWPIDVLEKFLAADVITKNQ